MDSFLLIDVLPCCASDGEAARSATNDLRTASVPYVRTTNDRYNTSLKTYMYMYMYDQQQRPLIML